ncbi:hypothetical protein VNO78_24127 [Psophocarpus tetragonolobus]|uniref:Bifunctional inhibitor/plant lipid transfer protein/seed storage helical domain-containing protein n=1 Tax=Psophocarpus tetragonolobus TaxID=3891 RepID=A0AAN9S4U4_PSOTE
MITFVVDRVTRKSKDVMGNGWAYLFCPTPSQAHSLTKPKVKSSVLRVSNFQHQREMASKAALVLCLNILFFTVVSSTYVPCNPPPKVPTHPPSPKKATCPLDTLKFGVCADLLGLINVQLGKPPKTPCCNLIQGLADLEAAVCLCTALKANVLGINLNVPIKLSLLLNYCGKGIPKGFVCA